MKMPDTELRDFDLDMTLDDIEDLPAFAVPLSGAYVIRSDEGFELKDINGKPAYSGNFTIKEAVEVTETPKEGEEFAKVGDVMGLMFMRDNEFGRGNLKKFLLPVAAKTGLKNVGALLGACKGTDFLVVIKRKASKDDPDKFFPVLLKVGVM